MDLDRVALRRAGQRLPQLSEGRPFPILTYWNSPLSRPTLALIPCLETGDPQSITMVATRWAKVEGEDRAARIGNLQWALDVNRASHNRPLELVTAGALARVLSAGGEEDRALELLRDTLFREGELHLSADSHLQVVIQFARLLGLRPAGRAEALGLLGRALREIEEELGDVVHVERRGQIVARAIEIYGALISLRLDAGDPPGAATRPAAAVAFDLHEAAKSRSFLGILSNATVEPPATVPPDLIAREARLLDKERGLREAEEVESEVERSGRLTALWGELRECWQQMRSSAPDYVRFRSGDPYTFEELRNRLAARFGGKAAFVSFFCGESETMAFVLQPGREAPAVFRSPVGRDAVRRVADRLRRTFNGATSEFPPYPPIRRDRPSARSLAFLYELGGEFVRFLDAVQGVEALCIAPHGPLHLIPFHALKTADGAPLARRHGVVYAPSLSGLIQLLARRPADSAAPPAAYVASVPSADDEHPEYFERDAEVFRGTSCPVTTAIGPINASRARVLADLPRHNIVHLSCHGYFDESDPLRSGLLLSDGRRMPPRNPWSIPLIDRRRFVLSVHDLLRVRLQSRLITLNACSSGLQGERNAGDELDGFSRALLLAGTSAVMLTLWNVDQQSSQEFLATFYRNWLDPAKPVEVWRALWRTQNAFLDSPEVPLQHPYHWAPFTLSGGWL